MSEQKFSLSEARKMIREEECRFNGHHFEVVMGMTGEPQSVVCSTCGSAWTVSGKRAT